MVRTLKQWQIIGYGNCEPERGSLQIQEQTENLAAGRTLATRSTILKTPLN